VLLVCTVYSVLHSEIALSRKSFGIAHMYIYTFLLRMTDTMTFRNIDFSSWDSRHNHVVSTAEVMLRRINYDHSINMIWV
jgi:hypothetical protein